MSDKYIFWIGCGLALLGMHVYIYFRIREALGPGWISSIWLGWSLAMMELPFLTRRTERIRSGRKKKWTDRLGGIWALLILYTFLFLVLQDVLHWLTGIGLGVGYDLILAFILGAAALCFGVRQANNVQVIKLELRTEKKFESENGRLRILHLTDLHLGPFTGILLLKQIMRKVREAKPDLVVVTGDLVDGDLVGRSREKAMFRRVKPKYGFFAVPGNHDYYYDIDKAVEFMESSGINVLRNEFVETGGMIVAGADDQDHLTEADWGLSKSETLLLSVPRADQDKFTLFLRHRPVVELGAIGHFDLQLSGHTHGGQLLPTLSSRHIFAGRSRGFKKIKGGGLLYISNGAGFVGPPVRFLAPPEITVIDLVKADGAPQ
ncbi:metallophosphoesterase [Synergistaceae bacterium OttesenSCG-928-D05]|nr:metallophosphoesterase [Synergistaceae bacterium OttesenSCG-928-D05]